MHRTIVAGSPRADGRSATVANAIYETCIEECPDDGVSLVSVASMDVAPCTGCDHCRAAIPEGAEGYPQIPEKGDPLMQKSVVFKSDATSHQCIIKDDMADVRKHLDAADELVVVSPVYFSGAPAQLKALLDRLQPYYWSDLRTRTKRRRPLTLHVIREGGDPHGFDPLVGVVESALSVAGFSLERLFDWIDCFDEDGNVVSEPTEYQVAE